MAKNFSTIEIAKIARRCSVTATPSTALVERCVAFNVAKLKALRIEDQTTFCHSGALKDFSATEYFRTRMRLNCRQIDHGCGTSRRQML
jgi:hypothetical protein